MIAALFVETGGANYMHDVSRLFKKAFGHAYDPARMEYRISSAAIQTFNGDFVEWARAIVRAAGEEQP